MINDLCTKNENLQRQVLHFENIGNLLKTELSFNQTYKNARQNNKTAHLQALPLTVSYGDKEFSANALLDSGSDSILITKYLANY